MFLTQKLFKTSRVIVSAVLLFLLLCPQEALAKSIAIKGVTKVHRMGGYMILINYETRERWTDKVVLKVRCKFREGEKTFTSSSLNNVERGWHKAKIAIDDAVKKRYGSLREYRVELYKNGVLVDTKESY